MEQHDVGTESNEWYVEYLCKRLGLRKALLIIFWSIFGLVALAGLFLFIRELSLYDFESASPYIGMFVFSLLFSLIGLPMLSEVRELQSELNELRTENDKDALSIEDTTKKSTRRSLIAIVCIIAIAVIIIFKVVGGSIDSSARCRECGKSRVYQYGYCYSCYKDVYNYIKENGK